MSIAIDQQKCVGCGRCVEACPGNLIRLNEKRRAQISLLRDCWGCTSCMKDCPTSAISYFLGADIGGDGSTMHIRQQGDILAWNIQFPSGETRTIEVDRRQSNRY